MSSSGIVIVITAIVIVLCGGIEIIREILDHRAKKKSQKNKDKEN